MAWGHEISETRFSFHFSFRGKIWKHNWNVGGTWAHWSFKALRFQMKFSPQKNLLHKFSNNFWPLLKNFGFSNYLKQQLWVKLQSKTLSSFPELFRETWNQLRNFAVMPQAIKQTVMLFFGKNNTKMLRHSDPFGERGFCSSAFCQPSLLSNLVNFTKGLKSITRRDKLVEQKCQSLKTIFSALQFHEIRNGDSRGGNFIEAFFTEVGCKYRQMSNEKKKHQKR